MIIMSIIMRGVLLACDPTPQAERYTQNSSRGLAWAHFVRNTVEKHYIIRSSSLFGASGASGKGGNFVETMIKKARNGEEIKVVDDMIMSPTHTRVLAEKTNEI